LVDGARRGAGFGEAFAVEFDDLVGGDDPGSGGVVIGGGISDVESLFGGESAGATGGRFVGKAGFVDVGGMDGEIEVEALEEVALVGRAGSEYEVV